MNRFIVKNKYHLFYFIISFIAILFRFLIPQNPRLDAVHDDSLMVELAFNILQGNWLGEWNSTSHPALTLFKPPGYPMYLALCMKLGLPPAVGALIIYLTASFLVVKFGFPGKLTDKSKVTIFLIFAFNPAFYGDGSSLVYRDVLNTAILTLILGTCFYLITTRIVLRKSIYTGIFFGLLLGYSALLKDDLKYIALFGFFVTTTFLFLKIFKEKNVSFNKFFIPLSFVLLTITTNVILLNTIKTINYSKYGVYLVQDNTSGSFSNLLSSLSQIKTSKNSPDVFIDKNQVQYAAESSKTFNILKPYLDSENIWKKISCNFNSICDQSAGFFQHELRDAFYFAGMARSAGDLQKYSNQMNSEIKTACENRTLNCTNLFKVPGINARIDNVNRKYVVDSIFVLNQSILNWNYIGNSNPRTLKADDTTIKKEWKNVPGIIWDYEIHPNSESALGMTGFKSFILWIYQLLTIMTIILNLFCFRIILSYFRASGFIFQYFLVAILLAFSEILMVVSNVTGWSSFSAAGNYFLIFSPFVVYFYSALVLTFQNLISQKLTPNLR